MKSFQKSILTFALICSMLLGLCPAYALTPTGPGYTQGTQAGGSVSTDVSISVPGSGGSGTGENPAPGGDDGPGGEQGGSGSGQGGSQYKYKIYYYYDESVQRDFGYGFAGAKTPYRLTTPLAFAGSNWLLDSFDIAEYITEIEEDNISTVYYTRDDLDRNGNPIEGGDGIADKYQDPDDLPETSELYGYKITCNYIDNTTHALVGSETVTGEAPLGSAIPYAAPALRTYEGKNYRLNSVHASSVTVTPDAAQNTVVLTYISTENDSSSGETKTTYLVTFDPDNGERIASIAVPEGQPVPEPAAPVKAGYDFFYWAVPGIGQYDFTAPVESNLGLRAVYQLSDDVIEYEVQHYKQALKEDAYLEYVLAETERRAGREGELVYAQAKTYPGFVLDEANRSAVLSGTLEMGSELILALYYNRTSVTVTVDPNNGEAPTTQSIPSGSTVAVPETPVYEGYEFDGWAVDGEAFVFSSPIINDTTIKAMWCEPAADADYTVEHYRQTLDGSGYELADCDIYSSKDGISINAEPRAYIGFTENRLHPERIPYGRVSADRPLVLKLYYDRNSYAVTIDPNNSEPVTSQTVPYGGKAVQPEADPEKEGFDFVGWVDQSTGLPVDWEKPITGETTIIASFVAQKAPTAAYTVRFHYDSEVEEATGSGAIGDTIPAGAQENRVWKDKNYMFVRKSTVSDVITEDESKNVIDIYYTLDNIGLNGGVDGGDGVPDSGQIVITFIVHFGTPSSKKVVLTMQDGKAVLTAGDIPQIAPCDGYHRGSWDVTPEAGLEVKNGDKFTYTYEKMPTYGTPDKDRPSAGNSSSGSVKPGGTNKPAPDENPILDKARHIAYIHGYPDGTVGPLRNITRGETAQIIYTLMNSEYRDRCYSEANDFSDMSESVWCNVPVSTLAKAGLVQGFPDGSFGPAKPITRGEFASVMSRFFTGAPHDMCELTDVGGHWAEESIRKVVSMGWAGGYPDGTFCPNEPITRAEAVSILNRVLERGTDEKHMLEDMKRWPDNPAGTWYYEAIQEASNDHAYRMADGVESWINLRRE